MWRNWDFFTIETTLKHNTHAHVEKLGGAKYNIEKYNNTHAHVEKLR